MESIEQKLAEAIREYKTNWSNKVFSAYKLTDFDIRQIFATDHEVNLEKDNNGWPIPGTGRLITNEEKKMIFDYILENNYPLTKKIYNLILHAYVNGEIELEDDKSHKL